MVIENLDDRVPLEQRHEDRKKERDQVTQKSIPGQGEIAGFKAPEEENT